MICARCGGPLTGLQKRFCSRDCNVAFHAEERRKRIIQNDREAKIKREPKSSYVEVCRCRYPNDYMHVPLGEPCQQREQS